MHLSASPFAVLSTLPPVSSPKIWNNTLVFSQNVVHFTLIIEYFIAFAWTEHTHPASQSAVGHMTRCPLAPALSPPSLYISVTPPQGQIHHALSLLLVLGASRT